MDEIWPGEWLRGVLELAVLRVLADGPSYGYAIGVRLAEAGFGTVKGGTLYPLLARLEDAGLVSTHWQAGDGGPGRKYFELTAAGRKHFAYQAGRWRRFTGVAHSFITPEKIP